MSSRFTIAHRKSHGNLHIRPEGVFDGNSAWELINLINDMNSGSGRIFIDTKRLRDLCPFGCHTFKTRMDLEAIAPDRLYFKGPKGFKLAPNGSRVIIVPLDGEKKKRPMGGKNIACRGCRKNMPRAMGE